MQPYFFPYLGYFQLINAVDKFIILDDVNFINKGYINRNSILINNAPKIVTLPLSKASQNKYINEISLSEDRKSINKILTSIEYNYKKAPFFITVFPILKEIIESKETNLSKFLFNSIKLICTYLEINTDIVETSESYDKQSFKGQERILDIAKLEKANSYINPIGGKELYDFSYFADYNINLKFIKIDQDIEYKQFNSSFVPNLSIIDVIMFNSINETKSLLDKYSLV